MKYKTSERVLGVAATPRAVYAVLLEQGPAGPEVVRRFSRQRAFVAGGHDDVHPYPGEQPRERSIDGGDDFTIEFGEGGSSNSSLFLSSEFGVVEEGGAGMAASAPVASYEFELGDILAEVVDAGYGDAVMALTLSATDAPFVELHVPDGKHDRGALIEALSTQYSSLFDADRAVFLPMSGADDERRYLATFPKPTDPVSATLMALRDGNEATPRAALVDGELSVLIGLARAADDAFGFLDRATIEAEELVDLFDKEGDEAAPTHLSHVASNTLLVRAGAEDTLVLFLNDGAILHAEMLRSLSAFDPAETICSRVLLQQDEHGRGEVHNILVLSEERESELAESFAAFFPDAQVDMLRSFLPESDTDDADAATALVAACGVALRVVEGSPYAASFDDINFLPPKLSRRKLRLPISAHMVALSVLIVATTLFFMTRYTLAETEIATYRDRLEDVAPSEINEDISVLQARIDSMEHLYATYTRAIEVLDTLLIGSDRWSRMLENTSREASNLSGFWIESLAPQPTAITIQGNATSRDQVVVFASRVDGIIESLTFSEIREWPVYSYSMSIPVSDSLPHAARYLRAHVTIDDEPATDTVRDLTNHTDATK